MHPLHFDLLHIEPSAAQTHGSPTEVPLFLPSGELQFRRQSRELDLDYLDRDLQGWSLRNKSLYGPARARGLFHSSGL